MQFPPFFWSPARLIPVPWVGLSACQAPAGTWKGSPNLSSDASIPNGDRCEAGLEDIDADTGNVPTVQSGTGYVSFSEVPGLPDTAGQFPQ